MSLKFFLVLVFTIQIVGLHGQEKRENTSADRSYEKITLTDYARIDSLNKRNSKVFNDAVQPTWIDSTDYFWYQNRERTGLKYYLINATKGDKSIAFELDDILSSYKRLTCRNVEKSKFRVDKISFAKDRQSITFVFDDKKWTYSIRSKKISQVTMGLETQDGSFMDTVSSVSPDKKFEAFIRDYNLWIKDISMNKCFPLSFDGALDNFYTARIYWSPDSRYITVLQTRDAEKRKIPLLESAPKGQLQPILHWVDYYKPGDVIPVSIPKLFDLSNKKEINFGSEKYTNQFGLTFTGWNRDSKSFTFEFNQRGHQLYQILRVSTEGKCMPIVNEVSSTFIHCDKNFRYDTRDEQEIIWSSERDGWRHLYLINAQTGEVKNQITKGEFVVREVENIDEAKRVIFFKASGIIPGEDPYNLHLCKINFDGTNFTDLTPENGNHTIYFSAGKKFFVDVYSRPDFPPISVLRDISGRMICRLEESDIKDLIQEGWTSPEVFCAKGRDGKTDIWGTIHRPSNFDPNKKYPVVEYIYAGPHDSHVYKSFQPYNRYCEDLCELGFIVVSIDGMGTANRSKAFHDVCWRNLKDAGFPDRISWIKEAARKYPYIDIDCVGIYGYSAGGQNAMGALLFHGDFYKAAVSLAGCHDNRMDKIWWNEQWMGYPVGDWYAESSNVTNAYRLKGKLLLVNGELDDNVDPASTLQVVDALIKANKKFEMMYLPGYTHNVGGKYGMRIIYDFFVENILKQTSPNWNELQDAN